MGCRQCLHLSVVQLKGKHRQKTPWRNGVVDTREQTVAGPTKLIVWIFGGQSTGPPLRSYGRSLLAYAYSGPRFYELWTGSAFKHRIRVFLP